MKWHCISNFKFHFLLLIYKKSVDFCALTLYPATILLKLINFKSFVAVIVDSLWFSTWKIMSYVNKDSFSSSLPISFPMCMFFYFIYFLIEG